MAAELVKGDYEDIRFQFLVALLRGALRNHPSDDFWYLQMGSAAKTVGLTDEEARMIWKTFVDEMDKSHYPKGFF